MDDFNTDEVIGESKEASDAELRAAFGELAGAAKIWTRREDISADSRMQLLREATMIFFKGIGQIEQRQQLALGSGNGNDSSGNQLVAYIEQIAREHNQGPETVVQFFMSLAQQLGGKTPNFVTSLGVALSRIVSGEVKLSSHAGQLALEEENAELKRKLREATDEADRLRNTLPADTTAITAERDEAQAKLAAMITERDNAQTELAAAKDILADAQQNLVKQAGRKADDQVTLKVKSLKDAHKAAFKLPTT